MANEAASLKPGAFTLRVYVPDGSSGATYSPCAFVLTARVKPVPSLRIITATLGTTAPEGSETTASNCARGLLRRYWRQEQRDNTGAQNEASG